MLNGNDFFKVKTRTLDDDYKPNKDLVKSKLTVGAYLLAVKYWFQGDVWEDALSYAASICNFKR